MPTVSIHVLRRGRCVRAKWRYIVIRLIQFQSTSSEEDVVSTTTPLYCIFLYTFQSTSSEEDVVSNMLGYKNAYLTLFQSTSSEEDVVSC